MTERKTKADRWLTDEGLGKIREWSSLGLTSREIATNMSINVDTLYDWIKKYPKISDTLKEGKNYADQVIENAMYKKAKGHIVKVLKTFKIKRVEYENGKRKLETEELVDKEEEVYIPPDTTAGIFWLKNRQPSKWSDKTEQKITIPDPITTINYNDMSIDDLMALKAILDKNKNE